MGRAGTTFDPDAGDDLAALQRVVLFGSVAGQAVEIGKFDLPFTTRSGHLDDGVECGKGHAHVGRMGGDAGFARAQDCVDAVEAADGGTAAAGLALVARRRRVIEIVATGPLEQIAACGRRIAQLGRCTGQDGAGQQREILLDALVVGHRAVGGERSDAVAAIRQRLDVFQRQAIDVDEQRWGDDLVLHEVDDVGAAGDQLGAGIRCQGRDSFRDACRLDVTEALHSAASLRSSNSTSSTASAMLV